MTEQEERINKLLVSLYNAYHTVNPFYIFEELGIEYYYVNYLDNPLGQYLKIMGKPVILLSDRLENTNQRYFIAAHELHHALAHSEFGNYYTQNDKNRNKIEYEANRFAAGVCQFLYIEEFGFDPDNKQDLENYYGLPMELSEILF